MAKKNVCIYKVKHKPLKRLFDIFFSLMVLILLSPVYLIISIAILFSTKGSVFYLSKRIGRGGKIIKCIKFRTMYENADTLLSELIEKNEKIKKEWEKFQKIKNDPRISPLGRFLRKTSLDELPQFLNVLIGNLSIVGPRPLVLIGPISDYHLEIRKYLGPKTEKILSIRPGITGLWQISGRSQISIKERVALEEEYIDKQSLWMDLVLIVKTIPQIFFPTGAY